MEDRLKFFSWMFLTAAIVAPDAGADNGIVNVASSHTVAESIDRLDALVRSKQLTVIARIDFSGDAEKAGLSMPPERSGCLTMHRNT